MKVLIVTNYPGSFPYIDELGTELAHIGYECTVLDLTNVKLHKPGGAKFDAGTPLFESKLLQTLYTLPKIGSRIRKSAVKARLKKLNLQFDIVNIHFASPFYIPYLLALREIAPKLVTVVWGSDFYRTTSSHKDASRPLYQASDVIVFGNPGMAAEFANYFGAFKEKIKVVGFGIGKLEAMKAFSQTSNAKAAKKALAIPTDKIVITCGYNGTAGQQHEWILKELGRLHDVLKARLFLVLPLSYGATGERKTALKAGLTATGIEGKVIETFLSDAQIVELRYATDIVVNAQVTDSLSASLQEHLFGGNILLAGDWLPYGVFADAGFKFHTFSKEDLLLTLLPILEDFDAAHAEAAQNPPLIYNFASWKSRILQWDKMFREAVLSVRR